MGSVRESYSYKNITTADTTVVKSGRGVFAGLIVNGGTMGAITIYDNTVGSGTLIATIAAPVAGWVLPFSAIFATGLTIVTAAASNITVLYE